MAAAPHTSSEAGEVGSPGWLRARLRRHLSELVRLAVPAVLTRLGVMGLGLVDTAMVGHYATRHLAWLNLANQSVIMFLLVVGLGLLFGVLIFTASAYGRDDKRECGRIWRRTLSYTAAVSVLILVLCWPADLWLSLLGQTAENQREAGHLIRILAFGLPAHLLFIQSTMFLEGIKRPEIGMRVMLVANLVNVGANALLIYGLFGLPELGAEGSAWASTIVRWVMGLGLAGYVWCSPTLADFAVRQPTGQRWRDWAEQRRLGYASAVSLGAEVAAFGGLAIYAGWLGTTALAAHGVMFQITGIPLMISIGIGVATSVRVGIAAGRADWRDTRLAGLTGVGATLALTTVIALLIVLAVSPLLTVFTMDKGLHTLLAPLAIWFSVTMIFDAAQMVTSNALRGLKETWWPTLLTGTSFVGIMLPVTYIATFPLGGGFWGLLLGTLIGCMASFLLQLARFLYVLRAPLPASAAPQKSLA